MDIVAGAASQLVARRVVRSELNSESIAPSSTAAGMPNTIAPRKIKASPSVRLAALLGMRIGSAAERTTELASARNCKPCAPVKERQQHSPHAHTSAPAETNAPQYAPAARL